MGVAGEIGENGLWSGERSLGVDEPIGATQRRERGVEAALVGERGEVAEEREAAGCMQGCEAVEEEPALGISDRLQKSLRLWSPPKCQGDWLTLVTGL